MSEEQKEQVPQQQESQQEQQSAIQEQQQVEVQLQYDVELETVLDKNNNKNLKKVQIRGVGSKETSFIDLFSTKKGREVFKFILEALKKKDGSDNKQIQIRARSTAIYFLLQSITELQHEKKITVLQTQNLTNSECQQVLALITVPQ